MINRRMSLREGGSRAVATLLLVIMVLPPAAQARQLAARADNAAVNVSVKQLHLLVGRSAIVRTERPIARVSLSTSDIADALVTSPYELLIHGKAPGTISLMVWADNGAIQSYDVSVTRDLSNLADQMRTLFPGEAITVAGNGRDVVLSGVVSTKYIVDRAASLAVGYVDKPENVVNLMRQVEGVTTNQVLLKVRFAEVSRSAVQEIGASFFTGNGGKGNWIARSTTQQFSAPDFTSGTSLAFSDFLNLFAFNTEEQLGALVKALKTKGLFQSLAEPNLITQDGKEASFLAGGEYPYPVVQGSGGSQSVTIVFKEYGVRLRFTPTITADDMIQLKVTPEVSTLDFANGITLSGFKVPALATRRTDTQVELRDGQTFAIAGLLDQTVNSSLSKVPGIGDIPILGYLFKSQAYTKNTTELVVMITPHIVRRDTPGVTPNLPGFVEPFLPTNEKKLPQPPPSFSGSASEQPAKPATPRSVVSAPQAPAATTATAPPVKTAVAPAVVATPRPAEADRKAAEKAVTDQRAQGEQLAAASRQAEQQRKRDAEQAHAAALAETARASQQHQQDAVQARMEQQRAAAAAKADAEQAAKVLKELTRVRAVDAERQKAEQKIADKKAAEQAVIDRKRWAAQQVEAARVKEAADKLAKEQKEKQDAQDKLAKEQAARQEELSRLVEQYKKLTGVPPAAQPTQ